MLSHGRGFQMFRQQVRRIGGACNFLKQEVFGFDPILHPEIGHCKMPHFAQPAASAYADRRGGIWEDGELHLHPQVQA